MLTAIKRFFGFGGSARNRTSAHTDDDRWWSGVTLGGVFGQSPTAGMPVSHDTAMTVATVYACTRAIAETVGSLPPVVFRELTAGSRERARGTVAWSLLHDEPNREMDSFQFWELGVTRLVNRGNLFAEIERDNRDRPIALWPIHNSRVFPERATDGSIQWRIYLDHRTHEDRYDSYVLPDRDMLNVVGFNGDGIIAPGVIPQSREEVSTAMAEQQYGASYFGGGARPSGFVTHPGFIDDAERRKVFREDINKIHSGRENWNKMGVLWQGATYKEIQANPEQAQFLESRSFSDKVLCRFWNVPPAVVQIFDDYKFSTVDAMIRQFVMTCIRSYAVRIERAVNRQVLGVRDARGRLSPAFEGPQIFEFLINGLLRGDPKTQAEANSLLRQWGVINVDEWRAQENENPLPGGQGQHYIVPLNYTRLDQLGNAPPASTSGGSKSTSQTAASFDRKKLAAMIEQIAPRTRPQVFGAELQSDGVGLAVELAEKVILDAVQRVDAIAESEVRRCLAKPGSLAKPKLAAFWPKQATRLTESLQVGVEAWAELASVDSAALLEAMVSRRIQSWQSAVDHCLSTSWGETEWEKQLSSLTESAKDLLAECSV